MPASTTRTATVTTSATASSSCPDSDESRREPLSEERSVVGAPQESAHREGFEGRFRKVTRETTQACDLFDGEFQAGHFEEFHLDTNEGSERNDVSTRVVSCVHDSRLTPAVDNPVSLGRRRRKFAPLSVISRALKTASDAGFLPEECNRDIDIRSERGFQGVPRLRAAD